MKGSDKYIGLFICFVVGLVVLDRYGIIENT